MLQSSCNSQQAHFAFQLIQGMSWVVDKSTQHASEKPDFEAAVSGILTGELTHVSRTRSTVGPFCTALLYASSTSAHSRGGGKKEEQEISAINGSQPLQHQDSVQSSHLTTTSWDVAQRKSLWPLYLLAFNIVCIIKTKESKNTSKQHGLLSSAQEWVKS